jgi:hypothetical protein
MLIFAAISGFIFVALGAFGAHVLSQSLGAAEMTPVEPDTDPTLHRHRQTKNRQGMEGLILQAGMDPFYADIRRD